MEAEAKADDTDSHGFQSDGVDAWHVPLKDGEASKQMLGVLGMVETALRDRGRGEEATEEREREGETRVRASLKLSPSVSISEGLGAVLVGMHSGGGGMGEIVASRAVVRSCCRGALVAR